MTTTQVTNDKGRTFTIRIVSRGDAYGRDFCLTHDKDEALVEFYDFTMAGPKFTEYGQFVSRYGAETLMEGDDTYGLDLHGGVDVWSVDARTMLKVLDFVRVNI